MSTIKEIKVPDIGDFSDVEVIEILVKPGDSLKAEDPVMTLESDKATMDVPCPEDGQVAELLVKVGDRVSEGMSILQLLATGASQSTSTEVVEAPVSSPSTSSADQALALAQEVSASVEVIVPDIGDFQNVEIIEIFVKPGDAVNVEDPLITLESDKATMEVPSSNAGTIEAVLVKVGDSVSAGTAVVRLSTLGGVATALSVPASSNPKVGQEDSAPTTAQTEPTNSIVEPGKIDEAAFRKAHASPSVRKFARELGVDLSKLSGSGRKNRITKEDVQSYVKQAVTKAESGDISTPAASGSGIPAMPEVDFSKFGEIETQDLPRIKKISGKNLHRVWLNIPAVTHHDEVDITNLENFRKELKDEAAKQGVRITLLAFIMKALAANLKQFPTFNSSLTPEGERLILKKYFHIGVAVDTPNGLVVPVIRDVDQKSVYDLARDLGEMSVKARDGKLKSQDMQGGSMTISSLGGIGGTAFTPLVNAPEVAILGLTRSRMQPVWNGNEFIPRLMQPVDVSYDHRVIDGAEAARFVVSLGKYLTDIRRVLL
ncbi:MAG TPA: dihydrolipoyllysine-residue acetyltransferase [Deltaproteobacteria bacterium]|nr:dihydrolipoyllysine-residue acetyltransferase [Deltaproteobacteria bacterium]